MGGIGTALAVAAIGSSVYASQQQKKAAEKASNAQRQAEMEARRIQAEQKPMEERATLGINTEGDTLNQLGLTVNPDLEKKKKMTGLGTATGGTGLGGGVSSALGFGS